MTVADPAGAVPEAAGAIWPAGAATGVGSMPGTDVREATALVLGELPDLPHLPELPARGPGADMIGRTASQLVELHVDLQPSGWRLVDRPGRDERRGLSWLDEDLDALEERAAGWQGPLKVALAGPWTLAAGVELPRGNKALADSGATRDLAESLTAAAGELLAQLARRVPGARLVLQLDEPSLPAVLAGHVPTASGWDVLRAVEGVVAQEALRDLITAVGVPVVVHCCADDPPIRLLTGTGAAALSLDALALGLVRPAPADDPIGEALEAGLALFAGVVPGDAASGLSDVATTVEPVRRLWHRLGLAPESLAHSVVLTPSCGLAGATPDRARRALALVRAGGRALVDDPEG